MLYIGEKYLAAGSGCLKNQKSSTYSGKDISPSLSVSKSIKKAEGLQYNSPGLRSPLKYPSLTMLDSDGGKTGTIARIRSAGFITSSPSKFWLDAKYLKI